jgi:hypothetical protein
MAIPRNENKVHAAGPSASTDLQSVEYTKIVDAICEGEIEGLVDGAKSIYLNGTPLQNPDTINGDVVTKGSFNFNSTTEFDIKTGTQSQTYLPGFEAVESEKSVNTEITAAASVTKQISNTNLTNIRVSINIPRLTRQNTTTGSLNGTSVQYVIALQSNGGGFVNQPVGISPSRITPVSGVATTSSAATGFDGTVSWTHTTSTRYSEDDNNRDSYSNENITFSVQYKLNSSSTWLTLNQYGFL